MASESLEKSSLIPDEDDEAYGTTGTRTPTPDSSQDCAITNPFDPASLPSVSPPPSPHSSPDQPSFYNSPTITITVGTAPHTRDFFVHETILRNKSPYFEAMLSRRHNFTELTDRHVYMSEEVDDVDAFGCVVDFMYTGVYQHDSSSTEIGFNTLLHVKAFLLADRLCMGDLEDYCVGMLWEWLNYAQVEKLVDVPGWLCEAIDIIYTHTPGRDSRGLKYTSYLQRIKALLRHPRPESAPSPSPSEIRASDRMRLMLAAFAARMDLLSFGDEESWELLEDVLGHKEFVMDYVALNIEPLSARYTPARGVFDVEEEEREKD